MISSAFEYHIPTSVSEAAQLLADHGDDAKILAGGHSLIPMMKLRLAEPQIIIDLGKIDSMSYIRESNGGLAIGAMTTYADIAASSLVQNAAPALAEAAGQVADRQVRNRGTIGGSLAHSDPAADVPPVVLALGGNLVTSSTGDHRTISSDDFFVDLFTTSLGANEILSEIQIPALAARTGTAYAKFANKASHYAIAGAAAVITVSASGSCESARVAITGSGPKPSRASATEAALVGSALDDAAIKAAASHAAEGIELNEDIHASAEFRAHLTTVFAERAIRQAVERANS